MSKVRSSYVRALLVLLAIASLPVAALAQNDSAAHAQNDFSVLTFQPAALTLQTEENIPDAPPPQSAQATQPQTQAAPPPPQVKQTTREIKRQVRRWHIGGRIGAGFSPEIFMFGLQSQIGPIFNPRLLFRPSAEFGFGELTDMFSLNLEGTYWLRSQLRHDWSPYFGMGPSLNFIHQGASSGDTSFSDFDYKTGFNVFLGAQKNKMFVEMKTSLWSGKAPVLRLFVGYNF